MNELFALVITTARSMWRRRWVGLIAAWAVAVIGSLAVMRMPDRFEATARVYVDTKTVLKPLMRDLTVEPDVDQTVQMLARTLITRPNVELIVRKSSLAPPDIKPKEWELLVDRLMKEIKLTSMGRENVFTFSFRDKSGAQARLVVENLVALFVESNLGTKSRDVDAAKDFLDGQIKTYEARLAEAENRLKEFKLRNLGVSDGSGRDYFARISALTDELVKLNVDLKAAEQSRDALHRELSGETAVLVPDLNDISIVPKTPELDARLDAQRKQLDELLRRYTDLHPDVISTRRLVASLEEQRRSEIEALRKAEAARPRGPGAVDPMIQQTKLALAESEASVAALRVRVGDVQARLAQLKASAKRVPEIEAESAQLNRDYEIVRRNYEALVAQREKASMSEEVDATRLAQFRVIDPPRTADKPVFPNRGVLALVVMLIAVVAGFASTFLAVQLRPTVDSSSALRSLSGRQVLGSISMLGTVEQLRRARRQSWAFRFGVAGLFVCYGLWLAWLRMPSVPA